MTSAHQHMSVNMTPDSAWRQLRGLQKRLTDLTAAPIRDEVTITGVESKIDAARNVWLQSLFDAFQHQLDKAKDSGQDISDPTILLAAGIPCITCQNPIKNRAGHKLHKGDPATTRWANYASCNGKPIDTTTQPMPAVTPIWP